MSEKDISNPSAIQMAFDALKLAKEYQQMASDYAAIAFKTMEFQKATTERLDRLISALILSGAISRDPSQTSNG